MSPCYNKRTEEGQLEDALKLTGVLRASFGDDGDHRATQTETVPKLVERKLNKALDGIDRHDTCPAARLAYLPQAEQWLYKKLRIIRRFEKQSVERIIGFR